MKYLKIIIILILSLTSLTLLPPSNPTYADESNCSMNYFRSGEGNHKIICRTNPAKIYENTNLMDITCTNLLKPAENDKYSLEVEYPSQCLLGWNWFGICRTSVLTTPVKPTTVDGESSVTFNLQAATEAPLNSAGRHNFYLTWNQSHPKCGTMSYTVNSGNTPAAAREHARMENESCVRDDDCQSDLKCLLTSYIDPVTYEQINTGSRACQRPPVPQAVPAPAAPVAPAPAIQLGKDSPCNPDNDQCQDPFKCIFAYRENDLDYFTCQKPQTPATPKTPIIKKPANEQILSLEGSYRFYIQPDDAVTKYRLRLSQGDTVFERDFEKKDLPVDLPMDKWGAWVGLDTADSNHNKFHEGSVEVGISAFINNTKSPESIITINLKPKPAPAPGKLGFATSCNPNDDRCQAPLKCLSNTNPASLDPSPICQLKEDSECDPGNNQCQFGLNCLSNSNYNQLTDNRQYTCQRPQTPPAPAGSTAPAGPTGPSSGGAASGAKIPTQILAHIHGANSGVLNLMKLDRGVVDVGARVYTNDTANSQCNINIKTVDLTFEKIAGKNSQAIEPRLMEINLNGNNKPTNCWSFEAKVDGAGEYRLTAKYPGDDKFAASEGVAYIIIADKAQGDIYAKGKFSTTTTIKIKTSEGRSENLDLPQKSQTRIALQKGMKVSTTEQSINLLELIGAKAKDKIAGLAVKNEGGKFILNNDPTSSSDGFEITPATSVSEEECSIDKIPSINLTVNKILNDGSTVPILSDPNYPNCQAKTITASQLGDISQINRVEISAGYPADLASDYAPSSGDMIIYMSQSPVEVKPFVTLSSSPSTDKITPYDNSMQIVAATNKVNVNPVFEVTHNGITEDKYASSATNNCSNDSGVCNYYLAIFQPVGQFTVTFKNAGAEDSISFNTGDNTGTQVETTITGASILIGGREVSLPLDGSQIDLKLDASGANAYQVIIRRSNLPDTRKTITFLYAPSLPPSPHPVGACGDCIFSDEKGCHQGACKDPNNCGFNIGCEWRDGCADVACPTNSTSPAPTGIQSQPVQSCPDNLHYCDKERDIWKHGGVPDNNQPGGCRYAFEDTGPCR